MTHLTDTHAHIYLGQFDEDIETVIDRCRDAGIGQVMMPNIDSSTTERMLALEARYPGYCISMMGLHPCSVNEGFGEELEHVRTMLSSRDFAAVGEIGIDLYWDKTFYSQQIEAFQAQIRLALQHDLPIVIHCRDSLDVTIKLVQELNEPNLRGIFHCFTGTADQARKIVEMGFHLGIGGVATFRNGGLEPVLEEIALDHLVLETDSPYLAPVPKRGVRNEPANLVHIAARVAEVKRCSPRAVAEATTSNATSIFRQA